MTVAAPENLTYGTVIGKFIVADVDTADPDALPDIAAAVGTVTITPRVSKVLDLGAAEPVTIYLKPFQYSINAQGILEDGNGNPGVKLIATDSTALNPSGWTYEVAISITSTGFKEKFDIALPGGATVDIALVSPATPTAGGVGSDPAGSAAAVQAASLQKAANLSDLASVPTARTNLGLGSAALSPSTAFATAAQGATADSAAQKAANLSDLADIPTARNNLGLGSAALSPSTAFAPATRTINAQTASYTLVAADAGKFVTVNTAAAATLTVPDNATVGFPVGTVIEGAQLGAGQLSLAGAVGVTVNATPGLKLAAQYGTFGLLKIATDTWLAYGRLAA